MSYEKRHFKDLLIASGFTVVGDRLRKDDACVVLGTEFNAPEWLPLEDYDHKIKLPYVYINMVKDEEEKLDRVLLPTSFYIAMYGTYLDETGADVIVDGLVYHYSLRTNPRNVHYAYRLYANGKCLKKGSDQPSIQVAKGKCDAEAQEFILSSLYNKQTDDGCATPKAF